MELYIYNKKIWKNALHTQPLNQFETRLSYGDDFNATLHFPAGTLSAGDEILVAIDSDMFFGQNGTSPMAMQVKTITAEEAGSQTATFTLSTNTERFYTVVNGKQTPVLAYLGIYQHKATSTEDFPQIELALGAIGAMPVVGLFSDTIVPVEPADLYYTKQQADGVFVAQSEKGIANGIATLDENGKVPESEMPDVGISPIIADTAPTNATVGELGQLYIHTSANAVYVCYAIANGFYSWRLIPNGANYLPLTGGTLTGTVLHKGANIEMQNANGNIHCILDAVSGNAYIAGGFQQEVYTIPNATGEYTFFEGVFKHTPDTAPTYTLPTVSNATRTHEIIIYVDFSNATSIAFQDASGTTISPLKQITITAGQKYCFLCQYIYSQWQIMAIEMGGNA